jgi:Protein of unknown function (DUF2905)
MRPRPPRSNSATSSAGWTSARSRVGPLLVVVGLVVAAVGGLVWLGLPLGRLPGDLAVERDGFRLYVPITTSLLVSGAVMLVTWLVRR